MTTTTSSSSSTSSTDPRGPTLELIEAIRAALQPQAYTVHPALRNDQSNESAGRQFHIAWLASLDTWPDTERTRANIEDSYNDAFTDFTAQGNDGREANRLRKLYLLLARTYDWGVAAAIFREPELGLQGDSATSGEIMTFVSKYRSAFPKNAKGRPKARTVQTQQARQSYRAQRVDHSTQMTPLKAPTPRAQPSGPSKGGRQRK